MPPKTMKKVSQLSVDEFKDLIGQIIEEKLQHYQYLAFYYDDDGVKTALGNDPEDDLPLRPEFEEELRKAFQDSEVGRTADFKDFRERHKI